MRRGGANLSHKNKGSIKGFPLLLSSQTDYNEQRKNT